MAILWGQWLGHFDGTSSGEVILNIDKDKSNVGRLSTYDKTFSNHARWANVDFNGYEESPINFHYLPDTQPPEPGVSYPTKGTLKVTHLNDEEMAGVWRSDIDTFGNFKLVRESKFNPTEADLTLSWLEFKSWLSGKPLENFIFRGQKSNQWKLKTSFHRTNRFDLIRFGLEDVSKLNHYLSSILNKSFDLQSPIEHGALLNIAQHHGFPTPLLDWTESPFIAAYFAFCDVQKDQNQIKNDDYVRLFIFNKYEWQNAVPTTADMTSPMKYFSTHQLLPIYNSRATPQQSVVTSTNINDIESWLDSVTPENHKYLIKIDIPANERSLVMKELNIMGITAASLFPGIEGTCKALKERLFTN
jgi:hypothetical protein